jgi:hypothetical protein
LCPASGETSCVAPVQVSRRSGLAMAVIEPINPGFDAELR